MSHTANTTHLSLRVSPDDIAALDDLASARGLTGRGARAKLVRALIAEASEHGDQPDGDKPTIADEDEVHQLLTDAARNGNVAAMHELRMLLRADAENGARRKATQASKVDTRSGFEKLDDELAERRSRRSPSPRRRAARAST